MLLAEAQLPVEKRCRGCTGSSSSCIFQAAQHLLNISRHHLRLPAAGDILTLLESEREARRLR